MQGLLPSAGQPPQPPQPPPPPASGAPEAQGQQPQQGGDKKPGQDKYDLVAGNMIKWIYENADAVTQSIQAGEPSERIGSILDQLINFSRMTAKSKGHDIEPRMIFQAGVEAAQAIGELMLNRKLVTPDQEPRIVEAGFYKAIELQGQTATLTDQERQAYAQIIREFSAAGQQAQGPTQGGQQ